jgi:hypothetical protein
MVKQIYVFSENRPGKLEQITGVLADANINIKAMKISSDEEYGVFQFLVDDPEGGLHAFKHAGITVSLKEVLAISVENKPGSLHQMLRILRESTINIEDCYGFVEEREKKAIIVLDVSDPSAARKILERHNYRLLGSSELYSR